MIRFKSLFSVVIFGAAALTGANSVIAQTTVAGSEGPTITPAPLGGTAGAIVTLNIANGGAQPVGTVINVGGLTVTGAGFFAPETGSWGACVYSADATPPASTTSDPSAFTTGPQLVFNQANNSTAQPLIIGATRRATQVSAILTCPILPAGTLPASNSNVYRLVLAAGAAVQTITPAPLGGTAGAIVTLNIANAGAQPVGTVINIGGLTVTGAGFVAPATGSWGACVYSADATPPASTTSDPAAFTTGPQLVFNQANNGTAQPLIIGATRRATQVSAIFTCPVLPGGTLPGSNSNVYRFVLAAGAPVPSAVTPVTAPGAVTLPGYNLPIATSSTTLSFNVAGANGAVACVAGGPGYTVAPNPLALVVGLPGAVTVTYTGSVAGTFNGTLTCNAVAPSTGGPFTYQLSTTVGAAVAAAVPVPTLGNISLMLLIAGFMGLGLLMVQRRRT